MKDYKALNLAMSKRKGECPDCHKTACNCSNKTAAVNPSIRATGEESAANGSDVQTELLRNPYEGPLGNPAQASEFENGYQNAQGLGHLQIAQAQLPQIQAWAKDSPAWRAGFSQAARTMGCGNVAQQINPQGKVATMHLSLPSFPMAVNTKIASALRTLAEVLVGAGAGAHIGAIGGRAVDPTGELSESVGAGIGAGVGGLAGYGMTRVKKQAAFEAAFGINMTDFSALAVILNTKIANALGTIAGTLAGASIGSEYGSEIRDNITSSPIFPSDDTLSHLPEAHGMLNSVQQAATNVGIPADVTEAARSHVDDGMHAIKDHLSNDANFGALAGGVVGGGIGTLMTRGHKQAEYFEAAFAH